MVTAPQKKPERQIIEEDILPTLKRELVKKTGQIPNNEKTKTWAAYGFSKSRNNVAKAIEFALEEALRQWREEKKIRENKIFAEAKKHDPTINEGWAMVRAHDCYIRALQGGQIGQHAINVAAAALIQDWKVGIVDMVQEKIIEIIRKKGVSISDSDASTWAMNALREKRGNVDAAIAWVVNKYTGLDISHGVRAATRR